jgi:hypothetical protein
MLNVTKTQTQMFSKALVSIKYSQLIINDLEKLPTVSKLETKKSYLLNSYIMNLAASWQTFIEGLVYQTVEEISTGSNEVVKTILSKNLNDEIKRFNNPDCGNIDTLFENTVGIKKITHLLTEHIKTREQITLFMKIRHRIAHKGYASVPLTIEKNFEYMNLLYDVAGQLEVITKNYTQ